MFAVLAEAHNSSPNRWTCYERRKPIPFSTPNTQFPSQRIPYLLRHLGRVDGADCDRKQADCDRKQADCDSKRSGGWLGARSAVAGTH